MASALHAASLSVKSGSQLEELGCGVPRLLNVTLLCDRHTSPQGRLGILVSSLRHRLTSEALLSTLKQPFLPSPPLDRGKQ